MDLREINRYWMDSYRSMKRGADSRLWVAINTLALATLWVVFFVGAWMALLLHCVRPEKEIRP